MKTAVGEKYNVQRGVSMTRPAVPNEMLAGEFPFKRNGATVEEYLRAADEDSRIELLDGVMLMHSPASVQHEERFWFLGALLRGYVLPRRPGRLLGSRTPMVFDDDRSFEPDLLFIQTGSLHRLGEFELRGPADLVIEILSPRRENTIWATNVERMRRAVYRNTG